MKWLIHSLNLCYPASVLELFVLAHEGGNSDVLQEDLFSEALAHRALPAHPLRQRVQSEWPDALILANRSPDQHVTYLPDVRKWRRHRAHGPGLCH